MIIACGSVCTSMCAKCARASKCAYVNISPAGRNAKTTCSCPCSLRPPTGDRSGAHSLRSCSKPRADRGGAHSLRYARERVHAQGMRLHLRSLRPRIGDRSGTQSLRYARERVRAPSLSAYARARCGRPLETEAAHIHCDRVPSLLPTEAAHIHYDCPRAGSRARHASAPAFAADFSVRSARTLLCNVHSRTALCSEYA